mmetsp:Transcript_32016/g.98832  ORF Transcript_32016/g.98832 Transcript_32016/m.98832 type:complete len:377 (-) Transcript_32016:3672-4802(-)
MTNSTSSLSTFWSSKRISSSPPSESGPTPPKLFESSDVRATSSWMFGSHTASASANVGADDGLTGANVGSPGATDGSGLGRGVGSCVGATLGRGVGAKTGDPVGEPGEADGAGDGRGVGADTGVGVGAGAGLTLGAGVAGLALGSTVGARLGEYVGSPATTGLGVGCGVGRGVGAKTGAAVGAPGLGLGAGVGRGLGAGVGAGAGLCTSALTRRTQHAQHTGDRFLYKETKERGGTSAASAAAPRVPGCARPRQPHFLLAWRLARETPAAGLARGLLDTDGLAGSAGGRERGERRAAGLRRAGASSISTSASPGASPGTANDLGPAKSSHFSSAATIVSFFVSRKTSMTASRFFARPPLVFVKASASASAKSGTMV